MWCRERKKKEERELRGERDSEEEDETPMNGHDPFQKLSLEDIKKKVHVSLSFGSTFT